MPTPVKKKNAHKKTYDKVYNELVTVHRISRTRLAEHLGLTPSALSSRIKRKNYYPSLRDLKLLERIRDLYIKVDSDVEVLVAQTPAQ